MKKIEWQYTRGTWEQIAPLFPEDTNDWDAIARAAGYGRAELIGYPAGARTIRNGVSDFARTLVFHRVTATTCRK